VSIESLTPEDIAKYGSEADKRELAMWVERMGGTGNKFNPAKTGPYHAWLYSKFPHIATAPLAQHHKDLWQWLESITPQSRPKPRVEVWARGAAKSETGQLGIAYLAERLARRFCLYVCSTQDKADEHVASVAALLEKLGHTAAVTMQGHSKGWRRAQVRSSNGFNLAGIGLDTTTRGVKLEEFRPDLMVLDDIDDREDTPKTTAKKERSVTQSILPAGSSDCVVLFLQNLIIEDGIVSRMVEKRADYLLSAEITGPIKAVNDLVIEDAQLPNGRNYKKIIGGRATWEGQNLEVCQRQILDWGWTAFKRESQQEVQGADGYFFDHHKFKFADKLEDVQGEKWRFCRAWDKAGTQDGGDWTVGVLTAMASNGVAVVLDVERHQYEPNNVKKLIDATSAKDKETFGHVIVHIPQDPSQAGKDQAMQDAQRLASYAAKIESVRGKKAIRAGRWAEQVNSGNAYLLRADWNWTFTEEHRKFREDEQHDYDDQVDAASDACTELATMKFKPGAKAY